MNTIDATQPRQSIASQNEDRSNKSPIHTNSLLQLPPTFKSNLDAFMAQRTLQTAAPQDREWDYILEVLDDALEDVLEIKDNELLTTEDIEIQLSDEPPRRPRASCVYRRELLKDDMGMFLAELLRDDDYSDCSDEESDGEDERFLKT